MQIYFCDTSKFGFPRAIGGILFTYTKVRIFYHINNQSVIKF